MNWTHGTNGLLVAYAISAVGVLVGRILAFPLIAIPALIVRVLLWTAMAGPLKATAIAGDMLPYRGLIFTAIFSGLAGKLFARLPDKKNHKRGTILSEATERLTHKILKPKGLTLAGLPVPEGDETKHFKMIGTTGTGKSTAIRELLSGALERGDGAVIADPDGSYLQHFYERDRGDVILNPFDVRAARWDLFGEMSTPHDANQLSRSLIADTEGPESSWRNYARVFLTSVLRQLHRVKHDDVAELYRLISSTPIDDLRDLLADTPPGPTLRRTTVNSSAPFARSPTRTWPPSNPSRLSPRETNFRSANGSAAGTASSSFPITPTKSQRCAASSAPGCGSPSTKP
jgi:hypothetical protein